MSKGVFSSLHYTAPFRRVGAATLTRMLALAVGLLAMTAFTMPELQKSAGLWIGGCLWGCLAYFAVEGAARFEAARRQGRALSFLLSPSRILDILSLLPVPIALLCGLAPPTAWLFGSLWVLKLAQDSPGFAQLGRVFVLEAKPLASVLVLFLIVLFLASAAMHVVERERAAGGVRHAAGGAVVGGGHADDDRLRRRGAADASSAICSARR